MSSFLVRRIAVVPRSARFMRLPGVRSLMVGPCHGGSRTHGEQSRNKETGQRT
jgi:hypothetical protein